MAVKNTAVVYIDGINRTSNTVMPLKWGNFLDERLDECHIALRAVKKENFAPLTPVEIVLKNEIYWKTGADRFTERLMERTKYYVVANDNAEEMQIGKGIYNHDLYLIEVTKIAECYVVDTITFTNDMGRNYITDAVLNTPLTEYNGSTSGSNNGGKNYPPVTPDTYKNVLPANEYFEFVSPSTIFPYKLTSGIVGGGNVAYVREYKQQVYINGDLKFENEFTYVGNTDSLTGGEDHILKGEDKVYIVQLKNNDNIKVIYSFTFDDRSLRPSDGKDEVDTTTTYTFRVVENKLPIKKWTITDVINRTLDLAEPIRKGEKPRFRLNGMTADGTIIPDGTEGAGQAALFDKILAPEFAFTKQTLRECLQEVGGVIHGEPRLTPKKDGDKWYYEVTYDMYASQDKSDIYTVPYIKNTVSQIIDSYTSYLDSNAENLVNQLDKFSGVIIEPYADGAKTMRTENSYVRIEEGNMVIATQYPIYSVDKLEYVYKDGDTLKSLDITPWLFEKSIYDTQLKSYEEQYPYSKAYGIYYTQGSKNISGLFFKVEKAALQAFQNYAIVNIINQASNKEAKIPDNKNYPALAFRVTYTPFYNARVGQTKPYYKDFIRPAALIYNQQSNVIESRYYGENLKGAVARLGTVEKSKTYLLAQLSDIPKAGQMFDKDYYISAVAVEFLPTIIKCTIGLSKDFNRLSRYIGISSVKRYSEISQTQAVERNTLYREYIVIGEQEEPDNTCLINDGFFFWLALTFFQAEISGLGRVTNVAAWGTTYQGNSAGGAVNLPVISSAFGNSISFSWTYEDNYSAGATSEYVKNAFEGNVSGYFQNSYSYTDYYGRIYYYHFDLQSTGPNINTSDFPKQCGDLPGGSVPVKSSGFVSTIGQTPYILRKDNREALQVNFQIDFVTNVPTLIIGSALASYNPAVRGTDAKLAGAKLYVFPTELNKFTDHVEAFEDVKLDELPSAALIPFDVETGYAILKAENFPASGKSWAIVTPQYTKTEMVEDETGEPYEQPQYFGGDLLIGQNIEVTEGQAFTPIYFTKKRDVFDKTVWKERR